MRTGDVSLRPLVRRWSRRRAPKVLSRSRLLRGNPLGVVVANRHQEELSELTDSASLYFATRQHAAGILEAVGHYAFFDDPPGSA